MNSPIYAELGIDKETAAYVERILDFKLNSLIQKAKNISVHLRKKKLTVSDLQTASRLLGYDKMLGHSNDIVTKYKNLSADSTRIQFEDSVLSISDIMNSEVPDIPLETTYEVSWFVVRGRQVAYRPEFHGEDEVQEERGETSISVRDPSIHTLSFECELYLKNIKTRMFNRDSVSKAEMYHQIHIDEGLKQICPYLVNWIQTEVQSILKSKPESMLTYLEYIMHVTHSLILNTHLNTVLYLHILLPCILSCCVGKTISSSSAEDHWMLRDLSALILADISRKYGIQYPKMQKQIHMTLNKILHNPKSTLPSVYGMIRCATRMGDSSIDVILLPVLREMSTNLTRLQTNKPGTMSHMQISRCLHAITEVIGLLATSITRGIERNFTSEVICVDFERKLLQLPNTRELVMTEAVLPMCYHHMEGVWNICDMVI